ncbi:cupin domain-containing protein [Loigolactobacillus zhaoyuanensis]|uniref:Cupin domain-containing protein n=1 Tax=Loigolactobacillus zhaoyuanensis TaxID=2486017 RepID=A0ABW8UHA3_9LACO
MKKLICIKSVEAVHIKGQQNYSVDKDTIITPAAKDLADEYGISFVHDKAQSASTAGHNFTKKDLVELLKGIIADGGLENSNLPFKAECHSNGLKVVKGGSVRMDEFETGNPAADVKFQELVSKEESQMSAGFLEINHSSFDWKLTYEEIDYVISGTLQVVIDGKKYTATAGDVLFVPSGSDVTWGSPDQAHIFYTTYPSNWADLV